MEDKKTLNKWRLVLGEFAQENMSLDPQYATMDSVLDFLYSREYSEEQGIRKDGGRGAASAGHRCQNREICFLAVEIRKENPL